MQGYQLLNCDDHAHFLRKHNKDPAQHRPDICHQALLAILDSPLNKSGHLKVGHLTQSSCFFLSAARFVSGVSEHAFLMLGLVWSSRRSGIEKNSALGKDLEGAGDTEGIR